MGFGTETIYTAPAGWVVDTSPDAPTLIDSPDGSGTWVERSDLGEVRVVEDGVPGPVFDQVALAAQQVSGERNRSAWAVRRPSTTHVLVEGEVGPAFEGFSSQIPPVFSPDGSHYLYGALTGKGCKLVLDGILDDTVFLAPIAPAFSLDGAHLAYVAEEEPTAPSSDQWVVHDGLAGPRLGAVALSTPEGGPGLVISSDGAHILYKGTPREGLRMEAPPSRAHGSVGGWYRYLDHQPGPEFEVGGPGGFSPEGSRFAYTMCRSGRWAAVIDGTPGQEYDAVTPVSFSPDGRRTAYGASRVEKHLLSRKERDRVVLDGIEGPEFDSLGLGPDLAVGAFSDDGAHFAYSAMKGGVPVLVVDGHPSSLPHAAEGVRFRPGSSELVYVARMGEKRCAVVAGEAAGPVFDGVVELLLGTDFSAYLGVRGTAWRLVVDGVESREAVGIRSPSLSRDRRHVIGAADFGDGFRPQFDLEEGPEFAGTSSGIGTTTGAVWIATPDGREIQRVRYEV